MVLSGVLAVAGVAAAVWLSRPAAVPVTVAAERLCSAELEGRRVQADVHLSFGQFVFCGEDPWGRTRCPLAVVGESGRLGDISDPQVWIYLGSDANRMHMPGNVRSVDDLVVFGNDGARLDMARPVRLTGTLTMGATGTGSLTCSVDADTLAQVPAP